MRAPTLFASKTRSLHLPASRPNATVLPPGRDRSAVLRVFTRPRPIRDSQLLRSGHSQQNETSRYRLTAGTANARPLRVHADVSKGSVSKSCWPKVPCHLPAMACMSTRRTHGSRASGGRTTPGRHCALCNKPSRCDTEQQDLVPRAYLHHIAPIECA